MLDLWELVTGLVIFGLGFVVAIALGIAVFIRESSNISIYGPDPKMAKQIDADVSPISYMSPYFAEVKRDVIEKKTTVYNQQGQPQGFSTTTTTVKITPSNSIYEAAFHRFRIHWTGIYAPLISLVSPVIVAFILAALYVALYLDLGTFTRSDLVVANYLTWVALAINYTAFTIIFLYLTGGFKSISGLPQLFGVGTLTFFVGIAYALGTICASDNQWLGLGAGLLLHVLVGLVLLYLLRDKFMVECGLKGTEPNICAIIRAGAGLVWGYATVKTLFLILGPEYTVVLDASGANIAQVITDLVFYIILTILAYFAAAKIEEHKRDTVLEYFGLVSRKRQYKYMPQQMYQMNGGNQPTMNQQAPYTAAAATSPFYQQQQNQIPKKWRGYGMPYSYGH